MTNALRKVKMLTVNCRADVRLHIDTMIECARAGRPLPEEIADIFAMQVDADEAGELLVTIDFA